MSKRIAIVSEGMTDYVAIGEVLKAVLTVPFVLNRLPGEEILSGTGQGWGGVLKWCHSMANIATAGNFNRLDQLPGLENYDAIIIHMDADVAGMNYLHCGPAIATLATKMGWLLLPCQQPTLPATLQSLEKVIASWILPLNLTCPGNLLCLPAQAMESWLAAAVLPPAHHLLKNIEMNSNLEAQLNVLPQKLKIKKDIKTYRQKAPMISKNWETVKQVCSQAVVFDKGCQLI